MKTSVRLTSLVLSLSLAIVLGVAGTADAQNDNAETYYYRQGEKVPLKVDNNSHYVLFKGDVERGFVETSAKSQGTIVRRFDELRPFKNLKRMPESSEVPLVWAIVETVEEQAEAFDRGELERDIVYESPFVVTATGRHVGFSHLVYVKLKNAGDLPVLQRLAQELNVEIVGQNELMPLWFTLSCRKESKGNALRVANLIFESGRVQVAEPDFLADYNIQCANDDLFADQWGLENSGQNGGTAGVDIKMCDAWTITTGDPSVILAVLDHGIELNHPDFVNITNSSFDTVTGTSPSQVRGNHGTACAGIAGAARNNGTTGVAGIAPSSKLMSISDPLVLAPNAQQNLANGLNWAWQNGAAVISNSWGHNLLASALIDDAIENALTLGRNGKGCVVVFATCNDNGPVGYPARSNPEILAVGAVSPCAERKNPSSCDGENWWGSNFGDELDIVAPGVLVPTTDRQGSAGYDSSDYFLRFNGTSSACPHAAGVAALILAVAPGLTQGEVVAIIESNAQKVGSYNYQVTAGRPHGTWHPEVGYGLLDAYESVMAARSGGDDGAKNVSGTQPDLTPITAVSSAQGSANDGAGTVDLAANEREAVLTPIPSTDVLSGIRQMGNRFDLKKHEEWMKQSQDIASKSELIQTDSKDAKFVISRDIEGKILNEYQKLAKLPPVESFFFPVPETVCFPDDRTQMTNTTDAPWSANCQLVITFSNGSQARGTGWLIAPRLVITAGHCVHEGLQGEYFESVEVIPGMNGPSRPFGSQVCPRENLRASQAWRDSGSVVEDYGAIILPGEFRSSNGRTPGRHEIAVASDEELLNATLYLSGYPGDKPFGSQWSDSDPINRIRPGRLSYMLDTFGGQSGSAVIHTTTNRVIGIHNYGGCPNFCTRITTAVKADIDQWQNDSSTHVAAGQ